MNSSQISQQFIQNTQIQALKKSNRKIMIGIISTSVVTLILMILMIVFLVNYSKSHSAEAQKLQELQKWKLIIDNFPYRDYDFVDGGIQDRFELWMNDSSKSPIRKLKITKNDTSGTLKTFQNNYIQGLQELILQNDVQRFQNNYLPDLQLLSYQTPGANYYTFFVNNYLPKITYLQIKSPLLEFRANYLNVKTFSVESRVFSNNIFQKLQNLTITVQHYIQISRNNFTILNQLDFHFAQIQQTTPRGIQISTNEFLTDQEIMLSFDNVDMLIGMTGNNCSNTQSIVFNQYANILNFNNNSFQKLKTITFSSAQSSLKSFQLNVFQSLEEFNLPIGSNIKTFDINTFPKMRWFNLSNTQLYSFNLNNFDQALVLDVSNNDLHSFMSNKAPKLKKLDISNSRYLVRLEMLDFPSLEQLILEGSSFLFVIRQTTFDNLRYLRASFCSLIVLENFNVPNLQVVELQFNRLTQFIYSLPKLTNLNLSNNNLQLFTLYNSPLLERLQLQNNQIAEIRLNTADNIKYLNLQSNYIKLFSPQLHYSSLKSAKHVYLSHNPLQMLQISGLNLITLEVRNTSLNKIVKVDALNLKILDLRENPNLTVIYYLKNNIEDILIDKYQIHDFSNNNLRYLKSPQNKFNFDNLQRFDSNVLDFSLGTRSQLVNMDSNKLSSFKYNDLKSDSFNIKQTTQKLTQISHNKLSIELEFLVRSPNLKLFNNNTFDRCQVLSIKSSNLTTFTNNTFMNIDNLIITDTHLSIFKNNILNGIKSLVLRQNNITDDSIADDLIAMNLDQLLFLDLRENSFTNKESVQKKLQEKYPNAHIDI